MDQVTQRLELDQSYAFPPLPSSRSNDTSTCSKALETQRYACLDKWTSQLTSLNNVMLAKASTAGGSDRTGGMSGMGGMMGVGMGMGGGLVGNDTWA